MPNQSNITKFFRPIATTPGKTTTEKCDSEVSENVTPNKMLKRKAEDSEESSAKSCLSPDEKQRIYKNQLKAKIKILGKQMSGALNANIGESWFAALEPEFRKDYFANLSHFLENERRSYKIYPPAEHVWSWTHHFNIKDTKVVILGQDPYHGPNQAHGLCFSVQRGVPPPPSLVNMYKELQKDIPGFVIPNHGFLEGWAEQGVLLLNACLTVRQGQPNSHKDKGWERLTDAVVKYISDNTEGVVFLLWGSYAQKKAAVVDPRKHHLLKTVHPSPLSAHRGFFGSGHFSKCNELLKKSGKVPIDWTKLE